MEADKIYLVNLKIGIIITLIATLFPLVSSLSYISSYDYEFGDLIFFWSFVIKDLSLRFYFCPLCLNLSFSILACIILNYYIFRSIDTVNQNTRKLAGESFTVSVLMILSTLNLNILIEYIFIKNSSPTIFGRPMSFWWYYFPNIGLIGMFLGSFLIIFSSIREMKKYKSPYYILALLLTIIILISWIIYYFYTIIFAVLTGLLSLFFAYQINKIERNY